MISHRLVSSISIACIYSITFVTFLFCFLSFHKLSVFIIFLNFFFIIFLSLFILFELYQFIAWAKMKKIFLQQVIGKYRNIFMIPSDSKQFNKKLTTPKNYRRSYDDFMIHMQNVMRILLFFSFLFMNNTNLYYRIFSENDFNHSIRNTLCTFIIISWINSIFNYFFHKKPTNDVYYIFYWRNLFRIKIYSFLNFTFSF